MIRIRVDRSGVERAKKGVVDYANRRFRAQVYRIYEEALKVSAQFSGDYVSNWHIVTQSSSPTYQRWHNKGSVLLGQGQAIRQAGHPEAVNYARQRVARQPFNYKQKVYLINMTPLTFGPRTVTGPKGDIKNLRPENIIGSGELLFSYLKNKFGKIS